MEKVYKIIFTLFLFESLLLIIGISLGKINYGIDVATPFMQFGISGLLIIMTVFRLFLNSFHKKIHTIVGGILSVIMVIFMIYYLVEDQFQIIS